MDYTTDCQLGLVAIKGEDDLTPQIPATQTQWAQGALPPVPTTLTSAHALLKQRAHVNINQYLAAREAPIAEGQVRNLSHLLHGDIKSLVKYTRKNKEYTPREFAKEEWLQPFMRKMHGGGGSRR